MSGQEPNAPGSGDFNKNLPAVLSADSPDTGI